MKYAKWVTRPSSLERIMPLLEYTFKKGLKQFISLPDNRINATYYMEEESYVKMLKQILNEALKDPKKHLEEYFKAKDNIIKAALSLKEKSENHWGKEIYKEYNDYFKAKCDEYGQYILLPFSLEEFTEKEVVKQLPNEFTIISTPSIINETQKMQQSLFKESIKKVTEDYGWLNIYSLYEEPFDEEHFNKLKSQLKEEEVEKTINEIKENKNKFEKLIKIVKNPELKAKCILLNEYAFIRTDRIDTWKKASFLVTNFYKKLAEKAPEKGWTLYETINLTKEEINHILLNNKYPKLKDIQLRSNKQGIFIYEKGIWRFITKKQEIEDITKMLKKETNQEKQVKGMKASPGIVQGIARIILSRADLHKIKRDDIMIAIVTDPVYTPFMKKCKAIVTNEGGITSHSAIISRELKIPCVIGTKHATEIFKDGDLIEVNGNTGIVKLLK